MPTVIEQSFVLPDDNWYQIVPRGDHPHAGANCTQVLDDSALHTIYTGFKEDSLNPNWPGILIDYDHFSLDTQHPSEAAGWITDLDIRPDGLWGLIRWSDRGAEAVQGGRYRFVSPVWDKNECEIIDAETLRPQHLVNCALTNAPNMKGMIPLSNRATQTAPSREYSQGLSQHCRKLITNSLNLICNIGPVSARGRMRSDEEMAAIHASYGRGGGGGGGGGGGAGISHIPSPSIGNIPPPAPPLDYSPTRDYDGRIALKEKELSLLEKPTRPELPFVFDKIDTRALDKKLFLNGNPNRAAIMADAIAHNNKVNDLRSSLKKEARKKYPKDMSKREAYLDKRVAELQAYNSKQISKYQEDLADYTEDKNNIQLDIDLLRLQKNEAIDKAMQRGRNAEAAKKAKEEAHRKAEQLRLEREFSAKQKREEIAERKAERQNDPQYKLRKERAKIRDYWTAVKMGRDDLAQEIYPGSNPSKDRGDYVTMKHKTNGFRTANGKRYQERISLYPPDAALD